MRQAKFNLHTHEETASGDSETPAEAMAHRYAELGFDLVGFVGHDRRPDIDPDHLPIEAMTGIEHEVEVDPRVHVVSFPDHNLSILAHPGLEHDEKDVLRTALLTAESYDVDAIEAFSRGERHLPGTAIQGFAQAANDDAHNTHQVGGSYMTAEVDTVTPDRVARAVREGRVSLHNPGLSARQWAVGRLHQGLSMLASGERAP